MGLTSQWTGRDFRIQEGKELYRYGHRLYRLCLLDATTGQPRVLTGWLRCRPFCLWVEGFVTGARLTDPKAEPAMRWLEKETLVGTSDAPIHRAKHGLVTRDSWRHAVAAHERCVQRTLGPDEGWLV